MVDVIRPRFFRLELLVVVSVLIGYLQYRSRYVGWPRLRTFVHFLLILLFAEVGACGLHTAIKLLRPSMFLEIFGRPNLLFLPSGLMCWLAGAYAIAGSVFIVAVLLLTEMSPKARRIFLVLVGPCTILYPVVMGNLTHTSDMLLRSSWGGVPLLCPFAALAAIGYVYFGLTGAAPNGGPATPLNNSRVTEGPPSLVR
jgi:hypothetical protein